MGQVLTVIALIRKQQYRIIYISDHKKRMFPITWPDTFAELQLVLRNVHGYHSKHLLIDDVSEFPMYIYSESSFRALVPKFKEAPPNIQIFYIGLQL